MVEQVKNKAIVGLLFLAIITVIFAYEYSTSCSIVGLTPRSFDNILGFLISPYLHCSPTHYLSNIIPLSILTAIFLAHASVRDFVLVTILIGVVGGIFTWIFGSSGQHLGSSLLVFGFVGFLLSRMFFKRSFISIAVGLLVLFLYGYLIFALFVFQEGVSWIGHAGGFLAGVLFAKLEKHI